MRITLLFLFVIALFTQLGCGTYVTGSGNAVDVDRSVGPFSAIDVDGPFEADVTVGPTASVRLHTDDNVAPLVETSITNGVLVVRLPETTNVATTVGIHVTITVPHLTSLEASGAAHARLAGNGVGPSALEASGSSSVTATNVVGSRLVVDASGASSVSVAGAIPDLELDASGASTIALDQVTAERAKVDVSGSSDATVRVSVAARGDVSGASHLHVRGTGSVAEVDVSGASTIDRAP